MNNNWSATKQRLYPQSVAEISRHSVLSGDRIRQCGTSSGSRHKDTDQCVYKSPFPSAGTAVSLFRAKTVHQRPLLPREVETRLPDCGVTHWVRVDHLSRLPVMPHRRLMSTGCESSHSGFLDVSRSKSLEYVVVGAFMKIFNTRCKEVATSCMEMFNFPLPSVCISNRKSNFLHKLSISDNIICRLCAEYQA